MVLAFPPAPNDGDVYNGEGRSWTWDATAGIWQGGVLPPAAFLPIAGGSLTGRLDGTIINATDSLTVNNRPVPANYPATVLNIRAAGTATPANPVGGDPFDTLQNALTWAIDHINSPIIEFNFDAGTHTYAPNSMPATSFAVSLKGAGWNQTTLNLNGTPSASGAIIGIGNDVWVKDMTMTSNGCAVFVSQSVYLRNCVIRANAANGNLSAIRGNYVDVGGGTSTVVYSPNRAGASAVQCDNLFIPTGSTLVANSGSTDAVRINAGGSANLGGTIDTPGVGKIVSFGSVATKQGSPTLVNAAVIRYDDLDGPSYTTPTGLMFKYGWSGPGRVTFPKPFPTNLLSIAFGSMLGTAAPITYTNQSAAGFDLAGGNAFWIAIGN